MTTSRTHRLKASRETLHGTYFKGNIPVLEIQSGDIIDFQTLEVGWRTERVLAGKTLECISPQDPVTDDGPALTGPVFIHGAEPGMTLEIKFLEFQTACWGWTSAGGPGHRVPQISGVAGEKASFFWDLDPKNEKARNQFGHQVQMKPFLGCVGLASAGLERQPGWYSNPRTGGNIDANVLTAGTSLFLPVEVPGGLLSVGDAHAAQGDGEVSGTAIECPMDHAVMQVYLHKDMRIESPRAKCGDRWVTFGIAESLDECAVHAMNAMLTLMTEVLGLSRSKSLALASSLVDLKITQMVNPLKGVHAVFRPPAEANAL